MRGGYPEVPEALKTGGGSILTEAMMCSCLPSCFFVGFSHVGERLAASS